jgi:hypothetical protein
MNYNMFKDTTKPQQKHNNFNFVAETDNRQNVCCGIVAAVTSYSTAN